MLYYNFQWFALKISFWKNRSVPNKKAFPLKTMSYLLMGSALFSSNVQAAAYSILDLGTFEGRNVSAAAINNSGQIAVNVRGRDSEDYEQVFLWQNGAYQNVMSIPNPYDVTNTHASAINDKGQILGNIQIGNWDFTSGVICYNGSYQGAFNGGGINNHGDVVGNDNDVNQSQGSFRHAIYMGRNGISKALYGPDGWESSSNASDINDQGLIVGYSSVESPTNQGFGGNHATLWQDGVAKNLGTLGGRNSSAVDINNNGQIIGNSQIANIQNFHATLWENGQIFDLGTLGGNSSGASSINDNGQIVGSADNAEGAKRAFIYEASTGMIDLNSFAEIAATGWTLTTAIGINDKGQIIGGGINPAGEYRSFLISPVPEPETYAMILAGLGLIGIKARRKAQNS